MHDGASIHSIVRRPWSCLTIVVFGVLLGRLTSCTSCLSFAMPHRWSPAKLADRRAVACNRGFLQQRRLGMGFVEVPVPLAPRVKKMALGLAAVQRCRAGFHSG